MKFYSTRDRAAAVRALVGQHRHVLLRNKNMLWTPARQKVGDFSDLNPKIVMVAQAFDVELEAWNREGGLCIYSRGYRHKENVTAHGAQVISECPANLELLKFLAASAREQVVVFKPPTWEEHDKFVEVYWPAADRARQLYALAQAAPQDPELSKALDIPTVHCLSDDAAAKAMGISIAELTRTRDTAFRIRDFWTVLKVAMRVPPRDRAQDALYAYMEREYPLIDGLRIVVESELAGFGVSWRKNLRALARSGSIEIRDTLRCFVLDGLGPDWEQIDHGHHDARRRLMEVSAFVEELTEFPPG